MAQDVISTKAGLVCFVIGRVSIAGGRAHATRAVQRQLSQDQVLFSEEGRGLTQSRTVLRIGSMTRLGIDRDQLTDTSVSIASGSEVVTVSQHPKVDRLEIHVGGVVVAISGFNLIATGI